MRLSLTIVLFQYNETPLHISARLGHEDVVKLLLERTAIDVDARGYVRVHYGNISRMS